VLGARLREGQGEVLRPTRLRPVFASRDAALAGVDNIYELVTTTEAPKVRPGVT
jgi:hypothetical protein